MSNSHAPMISRSFEAKLFYGRVTIPTTSHQRFGGARRDRTDDLMLAKHALSQLSYGPIKGMHAENGGPGKI